jgi:peroxiredoxin Q/BCP
LEVPTSPGHAWLVPFNLHSEGHTMLRPGDKAPDFVGRDHNGKTVKLSDFAGKPVVLWFFPKADTPG